MFSDKTLVDAHLDLSLYIGGLLTIPEPEVPLETTVAEKDLKAIIETEFEEKDNDLQTENSGQSKIPAWGQRPFKSLLVKLAGMDLMIPAMSVAYIEKVNRKITRLPLEAEAFYGVITLRDKSISVIDLLSLISENKFSDEQRTLQIEEHYINHVIVMNEGSYALSCDDVSDMKTLQPEDVRWNNTTFNNPMFAGVVTEYLCPIININSLNNEVSAMPFVQSLIERNS